MPRRKQANSNNGNGTSIKRSKTASMPVDMLPEIDGFIVRWDYEDSGKWLPHSDSISEQLTDRYNGGDTEVEVTDNSGRKLLISLDHLTQKTTNKPIHEGRIRCCFQDEDDYYSWQWQAKNGTWQTYCIPSSLALEKAFRKSVPTVDIVTSNQSFLIDLQSLKQSNEVDNVISSVQRIKSGGLSSTSDDTVDNSCNSSTSSSTSNRNSHKTNATQSQAITNRKKNGKPCTQSADKVKKECPEENGHSNEDKKKMKTVVVRGMAPVDGECPLLGRVHVYTQGNDVWDCMLNQTNTLNNNNKFYLIQLLQQDNSCHYYVWLRWGRVGYKGQTNLVDCALDLNNAIDVFTKKFHDKTKNDWSERHKFKKVSGKYDLIQMDYSTQGKDEVDGNKMKKESVCKVPDSKLDPSLQKLIKLISDIDSMKETVIEMKYDAQKAPLGRLTVKQIQAGYQALKKIAACIEKNNFGAILSAACDEFYTRIPHTFGMRKPPLIRDEQTVKEKMQLLEALADIEIAINILKQGDTSENPIDKTYKSLECDLSPISPDHPDFKLVSTYLQNTHAVTHNTYRMQLLEVYSCKKMAQHQQFIDYGNRMLLWHGSRLTNWVGILSRGLRIAPPEAPVTGDMFGKGIYFADMSSKSANYCFATKKRNIGLALLCEVSLGEVHELLEANCYADRLPPGKHSVKGLGRVAPHPTTYQRLKDGTVIPNGAGSDTGVVNPSGYTLNYNEYVVYDTRQVKMKYLVKIQFDFK